MGVNLGSHKTCMLSMYRVMDVVDCNSSRIAGSTLGYFPLVRYSTLIRRGSVVHIFDIRLTYLR